MEEYLRNDFVFSFLVFLLGVWLGWQWRSLKAVPQNHKRNREDRERKKREQTGNNILNRLDNVIERGREDLVIFTPHNSPNLRQVYRAGHIVLSYSVDMSKAEPLNIYFTALGEGTYYPVQAVEEQAVPNVLRYLKTQV